MTIAIPTLGRSFGSIVAWGDRPKTDNPVWSNSYDVEDPRIEDYVHDFEANEMGPMLTVLRQYALETKQPGKRIGALRTYGVDVMRYLYGIARRFGGRCDPALSQIAEALKISRSCVYDTLCALRDAGVLEWVRRTTKGGDAGPDRIQTSNLYRFLMPKALAWRVSKYMVRKFGRRPGLPRSLAATLTPEQIAVRATQASAERIMRSLRRAVRAKGTRPSPESDETQV